MPGEARWRGPPTGALATVPLDTLTVVYDRRSGQTHLLAEPLPQLLEALGDGASDAAALTTQLSAAYVMAEDPGDAAGIVAERLTELAAIGLIGPA